MNRVRLERRREVGGGGSSVRHGDRRRRGGGRGDTGYSLGRGRGGSPEFGKPLPGRHQDDKIGRSHFRTTLTV